ncbi:unnamed protein product [Nippostrongylus brasiliensis]|uniref:Serpentine receptor class gamma n=1 Tax=Nippostrongylus brasiliensis TaxID=27835 RepID=A0A0N4YT43_NIPBR|nr:unnamed protein product [Nippostrongylus brasiliensis]
MHTTPETVIHAVLPFTLIAGVQFFAVLILWTLRKFNEAILKEQEYSSGLIARYNLYENIRTITIVMPFCLASCIFTLIFLAIDAALIASKIKFDPPTLYAILDGSLLLPEYSLLLPSIVKYMIDKVEATRRETLRNQLTSFGADVQADLYFKSLKDSWDRRYSYSSQQPCTS